jgi:hypothetical protein
MGLQQKTEELLAALEPIKTADVLIILEMNEASIEFILNNATNIEQTKKWTDFLFNRINDLELDGIAVMTYENVNRLNTPERETVKQFIDSIYRSFESKGKLVMKRERNSLGRDIWSIGSDRRLTELLPALEERN